MKVFCGIKGVKGDVKVMTHELKLISISRVLINWLVNLSIDLLSDSYMKVTQPFRHVLQIPPPYFPQLSNV